MKNAITLLSILLLFSACEKEEKLEGSLVGQWELVSIYSPWLGESSDVELENFFQTYQFLSNGTFIKTRIFEESNEKEASGLYIIEEVPLHSSMNAKFFINLEFTDGDDIYNNCGIGPEEQLVLQFNNQLNNFSATPCDGPGFIFEKK